MLAKRISTEAGGTETEVRGVLRQSLVEAWGGFAADRFPVCDSARALIDQIDSGKEEFSYTDLDLLISALEFSLKELGQEEFHTITGYDFSFGVGTLTQLKKLVKELG